MGCQPLKNSSELPSSEQTPVIDREFRAAWVASVANINWPSAPGLPVHQQKEEALKLLDLLQESNFNAVIFQVRPQGDALYESTLEPWSYYLSGQQGVAPDPYYDPLHFWVEEAHKRNIELHVWLNPYRAHHTSGGLVSEFSVVNTKSELVVPLQNGYWWFDPSLKGTQDHSHAVVMDIVKRYDIDGVHFDDYFYPYPSYNNDADFPDEKSWLIYQENNGVLSRSDWRRNSVDTFIERVYTSIKKEKPHVKFGLSPFGIWRPENPASIQGFDQYEVLYADAKKWLNEGWVDYFTPQLYWPINQVPQSFPVLLGWWKEQNYKNRHLWPGMSIGRFQSEKQVDEVINQIMITRGMISNAPGAVHWSIQPLVDNDTLRSELLRLPYARKALVPPMTWTKNPQQKKPEVAVTSKLNMIHISPEINPAEQANWIVYARYENGWETKILSKYQTELEVSTYKLLPAVTDEDPILQKISLLKEIRITSISRAGIESEPLIVKF